MKSNLIRLILFSLVLLMIGCNNSHQSDDQSKDKVALANELINAFYSFNSDSLTALLSHAEASQQSILYYQKWAECGNYEVLQKNGFIEKNDSVIVCPITVKDDLIGALQIDFNVTDTFHIIVVDGQIKSVNTSSNDPDLYYVAREWVSENRAELIDIPCEGIWEDGPTPCECVKAMVQGYKEFIDFKNRK